MCVVPFQRGESRITTSRLATVAPLIPCLRAASCTFPAGCNCWSQHWGGAHTLPTFDYKKATCLGQLSLATSFSNWDSGERGPIRPQPEACEFVEAFSGQGAQESGLRTQDSGEALLIGWSPQNEPHNRPTVRQATAWGLLALTVR